MLTQSFGLPYLPIPLDYIIFEWSLMQIYLIAEKENAYEHNMDLYNEDECPVFEQIEVPKALGDLVESLIGAIFLDSGCDLKIVWYTIQKLFGDQLENIIKKKPKNHTAKLMELFPEKVIFKKPEIMKDGKVSRVAVVKKTLVDDHPMTFKGIGKSNFYFMSSALGDHP